MSFEYFTYYVFAPLILGFGLIGNLIGFNVLSEKKILRIGPKNMLNYLFLMDTIYLVQIIFNYLNFAYNKNVAIQSEFICKLYFCINYSTDPISSMLLVYLSVDRLVSIKYPNMRHFFRSNKTQLVYLLIIIALNLIIYTPIIFYAQYGYDTYENVSVVYCNLNSKETQTTTLIIDLVNRIVIPFFLMISCSVLLSITIFSSRRKISTSNHGSLKTLRRDLKFAITSVCLNLVYVLLNIPIILVFTVDGFYIEVVYQFTYYLFYIPYGINFYLLVISNSLFRKEFLRIVRFSSESVSSVHKRFIKNGSHS